MTEASVVLQNLRLSEQRRALPFPSRSQQIRGLQHAATSIDEPQAHQARVTSEQVQEYDTLAGDVHSNASALIPLPSGEQEQLIAAARNEGHQEGYEAGKQDAMEAARLEMEKALEAQLQQRLALALEDVKRRVQADLSLIEKDMAERLQRVSALGEQLAVALEKQLSLGEDEMLALVFDVTCRVLGENALQAQGLRNYVEQSMKSWRGQAALSIHLHPEDLKLLRAHPEHEQWAGQLPLGTLTSHVKWVPDSDVQMGGCLLRSSEGALDLRLETQLRQFKELLSRTRSGQSQLTSSSPTEEASR